MDRLKLALSWHKDWKSGVPNPTALTTRRAYLRSLQSAEIGQIAELVRETRDGRLRLAYDLARPIYDELHMVSDVFTSSNPLDLLDLADVPGDDRLIAQQRFEALCVVDLAIATYELERYDPMQRVEEDLKAMIHLLERRVFSGETRELDIYTYHDAVRYGVEHVSYDRSDPRDGLLERQHNSRCRIVRRGGLVTRFDARPKDRFHTVLKIIRQILMPKAGKDPYRMSDRCGMKFVVQDLAAARMLAEEIQWMLEASGARVQGDGDNLLAETGAPADLENPHSSPRYRKKQFAVTWNGRVYEIQIVLFPDYYAAHYALDDENHDIYKLGQAQDDVLPLLFPGDIYLEERTWKNESLRRLLHDRQIETLGWSRERHVRNGKH